MFKEIKALALGIAIFAGLFTIALAVPYGDIVVASFGLLMLAYALGSMAMDAWEVRQSRKSGRVEFL
jgi:hypothetical protein